MFIACEKWRKDFGVDDLRQYGRHSERLLAVDSVFRNGFDFPEKLEVDKYYPQGEDALDTQHHGKMVFLEAVMLVFNDSC